jgi:hypothetical protein
LLLACGQREEVPKPSAPNLNALVRNYELPSYVFDPAAPAAVRDAFGARAEDLERSALAEELSETLEQALLDSERTEVGSAKSSAGPRLAAFTGDGFARATRICNGWTDPPVPDRAANGFMEFVIGFTDSELDPVVFGTLSDCRYLAGRLEAEFTAGNDSGRALAIHLGDTEQVDDFGSDPLTFDIDLEGNVDGSELTLDFDFRVRPEGGLEFLVWIDEESLVVLTSANQPVGVRARNGEFACDAEWNCRASDAGAAVE